MIVKIRKRGIGGKIKRRRDGWAVPRSSAGRRRRDGCAVPLQVETRRRPSGPWIGGATPAQWLGGPVVATLRPDGCAPPSPGRNRRRPSGPWIGPTPARGSAGQRRPDGWAVPWSSAGRRRRNGWAVPWSQPSGPTPARGSAGRRRRNGWAVPWSQPSGPTPARRLPRSLSRSKPTPALRPVDRPDAGAWIGWATPARRLGGPVVIGGATPARWLRGPVVATLRPDAGPWIGWATPARWLGGPVVIGGATPARWLRGPVVIGWAVPWSQPSGPVVIGATPAQLAAQPFQSLRRLQPAATANLRVLAQLDAMPARTVRIGKPHIGARTGKIVATGFSARDRESQSSRPICHARPIRNNRHRR